MHVDSILKTKGNTVFTVLAEASIADAVAALNRHKIGALVVTNADGAVVGILSERDVVRYLSGDAAQLLSRKVRDCMTAKVITVDRSASVAELMERMTRSRIRHIPVVENGELVGIVSIGDVVKRKIEQAEQEASAMREYIAS